MTGPSTATSEGQRNRPIRDLREWLAEVQRMGELSTIDASVDWDEEMSALSYLVAKLDSSPALLFENPKDYESSLFRARLLWNVLGPSLNRVTLTFEEPPGISAVELIRRVKDKTRARIEPREVPHSEAPLMANTVKGSDLDLFDLPIPRHWPLDGGRYAGTGDAVITRDPDTGYLNVGTYRMMLQGSGEVGLYLSPGKDARLHITRAWERGESLPVAAAWGIDPLFMVVGSQTFAKNVSEYEFAGGIKGEAIPVVRGAATDLLLPANAELVIEGEIRPGSSKEEGPFGEFTGYYGRPEGACPLVDVTAVHYRHDPILTNALMADYPSNELAGFYSVGRSARIWNDLDGLGIPGIAGVYAHPAAAGGFAATVISLEQRYAGHAAQALALAAQAPGGAYFAKWIIAVDEDVDPSDMDQVMWAMSTRCNPVDDVDILRNTWSTWLDPTQNPPERRPFGSKALINACKDYKHLPTFSKRTALRKSTYDRVVGRWKELGMPGEPPEISFFEEASGEKEGVYHETGEFESKEM